MLQFNTELMDVASSRINPVLLRYCHFTEPLHLPPPIKSGQTFGAGEKLLHSGLFEFTLLDDELVQRADQRIYIAQRPRDGALFGRRRIRNEKPSQIAAADHWLSPLFLAVQYLSFAERTFKTRGNESTCGLFVINSDSRCAA